MLFETFIPMNKLVSSNVTMKSVLLFFCFTGLGVLLECRHRITQCAYPCLSVRDKLKVLIQGNQWLSVVSWVKWDGDPLWGHQHLAFYAYLMAINCPKMP